MLTWSLDNSQLYGLSPYLFATFCDVYWPLTYCIKFVGKHVPLDGKESMNRIEWSEWYRPRPKPKTEVKNQFMTDSEDCICK